MKFICWLHWLDGNGVHARHPIGLAQVMLGVDGRGDSSPCSRRRTPAAARVASRRSIDDEVQRLESIEAGPAQRCFVAIGGKTEARAVDGRVDDQQAPPIRP